MNPDAIVECVPNFSEGRDEKKVREIVRAMRVEGVKLLDWSLDPAHNRSVVTIAGTPQGVVESAVQGAGKASQLINLTQQTGEHPRIGAADVIPFVPVSGVTLAECAVLARQAGIEIWRRFGVPVYFYGAAAARPDRVQLENVRRGQFEGLREAVHKDASRRPDIGGPELHATAGASVVGARSFLIAYNVFLNSDDIATARAVAREIRAANGGVYGLKAMGAMVGGRAQVSMNITEQRAGMVKQVYEAVCRAAAEQGVETGEGELIGLIPEEAYEPDSDWVRQIPGFDPATKVLERKLNAPIEWP